MKKHTKTKLLLLFLLVIGLTVLPVLAAPPGWSYTKPSGSVVSAYGTPAEAFSVGPVYNSQMYYQASPTKNTNNVPFTIPYASSFFTVNPGWVLDYVYVSGNSSGSRSQGSNFYLSSSGGSMVYYFRRI